MSKRTKSNSRSKKLKQTVGGPFVSIAIICEKSLRESDGVHSLVRIFDRLTVPMQTDATTGQKIKGMVSLTLVISFKSGDFKGTKPLEVLVRRTTTNETKPLGPSVEIAFEGDEQGPVMIAEVLFEITGSDLIWFDVMLDKRVISRIPLRIVAVEPTTQAAKVEPAVEKQKKGKAAKLLR